MNIWGNLGRELLYHGTLYINTSTTFTTINPPPMDSPLVQLAIEKWPFIALALVVVGVSIGLPMLIAEVFPWKNLYRQRNAKLTVTTKSYKGKTVLITGANGAFGSRAAKLFADREVETLILVDVMDCTRVKAEIEAAYPATLKKKPTILVWQVDMMSYASCEELSKKLRTLKSLDHALLTAGILSFNRRVSPEGWETCKSFHCSQLTLSLLVECDNNGITLPLQPSKSTTSPVPSSASSSSQSSNPLPATPLHQSSPLSPPSEFTLPLPRWVSPRRGPTSDISAITRMAWRRHTSMEGPRAFSCTLLASSLPACQRLRARGSPE